MAIMPTNIRPVILELIVSLSSRRPSQRAISRVIGCHKIPFEKSFAVSVTPAALPNGCLGINGHRLMTTTFKEYCALLYIARSSWFVSSSKNRVQLIRWTGHHAIVFTVQRQFKINWTSIKTFRQITQTDSWSSPPPPHLSTRPTKFEPLALFLSDSCWWDQGQSSLLSWSSCLRIPSVIWMQQSKSPYQAVDKLTHHLYNCRDWSWTHQQKSLEINTDRSNSGGCVCSRSNSGRASAYNICLNARGDIQLLLNSFGACEKRHNIQFAWSAPVLPWMVKEYCFPLDTENSMVLYWCGRFHSMHT